MAHLCDGVATVLANTAIADTVVFCFCRERRRASRHSLPKSGCTPLEGKTEEKQKSVTSTTPQRGLRHPSMPHNPSGSMTKWSQVEGRAWRDKPVGILEEGLLLPNSIRRDGVFHTRCARHSALKRSERTTCIPCVCVLRKKTGCHSLNITAEAMYRTTSTRIVTRGIRTAGFRVLVAVCVSRIFPNQAINQSTTQSGDELVEHSGGRPQDPPVPPPVPPAPDPPGDPGGSYR